MFCALFILDIPKYSNGPSPRSLRSLAPGHGEQGRLWRPRRTMAGTTGLYWSIYYLYENQGLAEVKNENVSKVCYLI